MQAPHFSRQAHTQRHQRKNEQHLSQGTRSSKTVENMLTRKQMWRRATSKSSRAASTSRCMAPTPPAPPLSHRRSGGKDSALRAGRPSPAAPIDSLSIGDSLLHLLGTPATAPGTEEDSEREPDRENSDTAVKGEQDARGSPKTVSFKSQVRVVLVPCRRELHSLNAQLWWGADDYVDFRREYILAVKAAAAAASQPQQDDEQQHRPLHPEDHAAADETRGDVIDTPPPSPPPTPLCPPSSLPSASLSTPLPPTDAEAAAAAAAAAAKVTIGTSSGQRQHEQGARGGDGVLLATSISSEALAAAAAAGALMPSIEHGSDEVGGETAAEMEESVSSPSPPPPPLAKTRSLCVQTAWTAFAGAAAAKAAAETSDESGYRTTSTSSASDCASGGCNSDSDDSPDDEDGDSSDGYESDREDGRAPDGSNKRLVVTYPLEEEEHNLSLQGRA